MEYNTSIILDTRRKKGNDLYPVKLRVYSVQLKLKKLYATKYDLSESDFKSIWETKKPRNEHKETRNELQAIELRADEVCKNLKPFSFTGFEKKYLRSNGDNNNIINYYKQTVVEFKSNGSISTSLNYEVALKSFIGFIKHTKGKEPIKIPFSEITPDWLNKYEKYMITDLERSRTTVSMYIRTLRTVFNTAIREKEIDIEIYPFGKNKYQPPTVRNVRKALSYEHLTQLFNAEPKTPEQIRAKDFWFFSYACNGMNIKDIALLKYENIKNDTIVFYRAKTLKTAKTDLRPVTVYLTKLSSGIIKKYGNKDKSPKSYLFPIISDENTEFENHRAIKNFTIFINKNLKKLAKANGLTGDISTYWARHSFATNAIRNGATMEFVSEALSHNNLKTTQNYFAGFDDKDKKEFMQKMMEF